MDLNDLLSAKGIDTKETRVIVMRHTPKERQLRRALPWLAAEEPELFNTYQQWQSPRVEKQLVRAGYLVSFIGHNPNEALFIGLYEVAGHRSISRNEYWKMPRNLELEKRGMKGLPEDRSACLWFELSLTDIYQQWKGKLILGWPPPRITFARRADRNEFPVKAILEESILDKGMPRWNELLLTWEELTHLPKSWINVLLQWRGVYLIVDAADGKAYVGSAYGDENPHGRWASYATSGHGGNKRLRDRPPDKFLFSILELASPTASPDEIIRLEDNWKDRLRTREFGLNEN